MIHLQCHFGLDILILAREGAVATGLDFSPSAIAEARRLAAEIGVAADFVCADVYDAPQVVDGEFNIVFTTGVRSAGSRTSSTAETIASLPAPGGVFYFADAHPAMLFLEGHEGRLIGLRRPRQCTSTVHCGATTTAVLIFSHPGGPSAARAKSRQLATAAPLRQGG